MSSLSLSVSTGTMALGLLFTGPLSDAVGRKSVMVVAITIMIAGLLLTLATPLAAIFVGMMLFVGGFFAAHSVASGWIGWRARCAKGQAFSLYLFCYYLGSSTAGTLGGFFWHGYGWGGVVAFITALLLVGLYVAQRLRWLPELRAV